MKTQVGDTAFAEAEKIIDAWIEKCKHFNSRIELDEEGKNSLVRMFGIVIEAQESTMPKDDSTKRHFLVTNQAYALLAFWKENAKKLGHKIKFDEISESRLVRLLHPFLAKVTPTSFHASVTNPGGKPE